jgi:hypothetical protein
MNRRLPPVLARIAAATAVLAGTLAGCGVSAPGCDLTIVGLPDGVMLEPGSTLPPGAEPIAVTADLDVVPEPPDADAAGASTAFAFRLRPAAAARMAAYTETHVGQALAITVDGVVATAPMITGQLGDEVVVALTDSSTFETATRLNECIAR